MWATVVLENQNNLQKEKYNNNPFIQKGMKTLTQNPPNKTQFIEKGDNKFTYKSSLPYL